MLTYSTYRLRTAVFLLAMAVCLGVSASVFRSLGQHWSGWVPVGNLPWEQAYQTQMVVNGKRVELYVYTSRYTEPVGEQLKAVLEAIGATMKPGSTGLSGVATLNGYAVKYVVSSPPDEPRHLIFLSYSDPGGAVRQVFPLQLYPNGTVLSTVSDLATGADHVTLRTTDTATQVHEFYRDQLASEGWSAVKPPLLLGGEYKGLAIYGRKGRVCFIHVVPGINISNTVTVLVNNGN